MTDAEHERPRAILFDWDNTLIDSWSTIHEVQNIVLAAYGLEPWSLDEIRRRVRESMRDAYPRLFGDRWEEAGRLFRKEYAARHLDRLTALPGAGDMLAALAGAGIYLGVVSNKGGELLRREANHLDWTRHFAALIGASDAARDKPAPDPVLMALGSGGPQPGPDVWFVGDTDIDMECAHASGCRAVLLRAETPAPEEFTGAPPALLFTDCPALSNHVLRM